MALFLGIIALAGGGVAMWYVAHDSRPRVTRSTERKARVVSVRGATAVESGADCTVRIEPAKGRPYNCRVVIQCGQHKLFGTTATNGFAHCEVEAGVATRAHESEPDDSDPDVDYDTASRRVTLADRTWQIELELLGDG
ncbi:MAG: hypothetical protein JRI23_35715 [Deltaproteobacteria bacterium]|jgi:hypothetical protein|nr:hypothetical protein [Deltaproteobacteria bacterium]MBW2537680.1 hypothetical protein [Deltaproteobacteria bacterium]